jgi:ribosomal protein S6--L-glutamate ligase
LEALGEALFQGAVVLVIEGNYSLLALLCLTLAKGGIAIERAATAAEGLRALASRKPDAVILDVALPDLSGWELLRRMRESSDVPVMLVSDRDSQVDKARGLDLGADDYVTVPFGPIEFEARVRALLRRTRRDASGSTAVALYEPEQLPIAVAFIADHRHLQDEALCEAIATFETLGYRVEVLTPDGEHPHETLSALPSWDAVLMRGRDMAGLSVLTAASALGVVAVNPPASIELVRNKIAMQALLANHGLPTPKTWFARGVDAFKELPSHYFPLIVKPFDGDGADGLALLRRPQDTDLIRSAADKRALFIAQEFVETDGYDLKLYGIGSRVWAVRKRSPVLFTDSGPATRRASDTPELVPIDARLRDIALTCGRAFGLELWGVDIAVNADGPKVLEVNDFPTYSGVPGAGAAIAHHTLLVLQSKRLAGGAAGHQVSM